MKRFSKLAVATAIFSCIASCANHTPQGEEKDTADITFTAITENSQSRTSLGEGNKILWSESDSISVFTAEGQNVIFRDVTVSQDSTQAQFSGSIPISSAYQALYPASTSAYYEAGSIFTEIPSEQSAVEGSFDPKANAALAQASAQNLYFRNIGALVGIIINNDDITSVTLNAVEEGSNSLTGRCSIQMQEGIPSCTVVDEEDWFSLSGDFVKGKTYYAVVYPGTYGELKITYTDIDGRTATFTNPGTFTIARNEIKDIIRLTVSEADWEEPLSTDWTLVTSTEGLVAGNSYLIACNATGDSYKTCVVAGDLDNKVLDTINATPYINADKSVISDTPAGATVFTLGGTSGAWTLSNADGKLLGTSKAKELGWGSGTTTWSISFNSNNAVITSTTSSYGTIKYNPTNPRFTTYASSYSGKTVQLYSRISASSVTTVAGASDISESTATLEGSYVCINEIPSEAGFLYGLSESNLTGKVYASAPTAKSGTFSAVLSALNAGTTYYFKAFIKEGNTYRYGSASSFTTSTKGGGSTGKADYGWPELPAQTDKDGNGIDDNNPDYYYSHTICAGRSDLRNFSSCYSKSKIHPVWVAAPMHSCYKGSSGRSEAYKDDPNIKCTQSAKFSGYTRGHMVGSSERTLSTAINQQVFYYSNIGAQIQTGFNTGGGAWNNLETKVDESVCSDTLYQVIGCIFDTFTDKYGTTVNAKTGTNGAGNTFQVPTAWYTVLLRTKKGNSGKWVCNCTAGELQCAAFILGHYSNQSHKPTVNDMYSVSEVEKLTGLTFFVNVPNAPKDSYTSSDWGL